MSTTGPSRNEPVNGGRIAKPQPGRLDPDGIIDAFAHRLTYQVGKAERTATKADLYQALAYAVRDRIMDRWLATQDTYHWTDPKRVYYLSMEFLTGRALLNNILSLGAYPAYREALGRLGYELEALQEQEWDAGLGNGGLGRLAACLLDSAATLSLPVYGYGIRYEYGIFTQHIRDGHQVEAPDNWLRYGNCWEVPRPDALYPVRFYGQTQEYRDAEGRVRLAWVGTERVMAMAYDMPILGYGNDTVNTLRLWAAKSTRDFDLARFNAGEYVRAVEAKYQSEAISHVLYPADDQHAGKELRLKQQYFFVSATLQDLIRRFKRGRHPWSAFADKVAIQLNDTHPAIAIAELMRVLLDREGLAWEAAWGMAQPAFGYTNHTILPEALERWPAPLLGRLLPRHLQIIEEIDRRFRATVRERHPGDEARVARMAIIADDDERSVRMAHLAVVGSHAVNGVARLHTELLRTRVFPDFDAFYPGRLTTKANGITPRRWLLEANPRLAALITEAIGDGWVTDLAELRRLEGFVEDGGFRARWKAVKRANKAELAAALATQLPVVLDPDTVLDCQVKRIHEYKRQLLNLLHVIALYHRIRDGAAGDEPPRTVLFAGKAAPSYVFAKLVIKLIHAVAELVNGDRVVAERLRVIFVPNYGVSIAERIFPACELSEQISTAGTEASGTGNMKAALNGGVIIGTLDGANIEIRQEVGEGNMFIFGRTVAEIEALRAAGYDPNAFVAADPELARVIHTLAAGELERAHPGLFRPVVDALLGPDAYFHCADFASYRDCQARAGATYPRDDEWTRMSIRNVAGMGWFSSDRTMREYAEGVWRVTPVPVKLG
jgi:starch phosphorylase